MFVKRENRFLWFRPVLGTVAVGLLVASAALADRPAGDYSVQPWHLPSSTGGVHQQLAASTPSYAAENGSGWWFCGHAAVATSMNYLRGGWVSQHDKITQLEWFHQQLKARQAGYSSDPHRQASIDALKTVVQREKADEFAVAKITGLGSSGRSYVRDAILDTLRIHSSYAIVLSERVIGGVRYGHFYAVYKVKYRPGTTTGGTAYFWDPYSNSLGSMDFSELMDGMKRAGQWNRYSFLRLYRYP